MYRSNFLWATEVENRNANDIWEQILGRYEKPLTTKPNRILWYPNGF